MIQITCKEDAAALKDDPILHREILGYLGACRADCDDNDDLEVDFMVLDEKELTMLTGLGDPEEMARIEIHTCDQVRVITRLIFVSTVYFVTGDLGKDKAVAP